MPESIELLRGDFVMVDLGSADSPGFRKELGELLQAVTLVELDAVSNSTIDGERYFQSFKVHQAISGTPGKRRFLKRKYPQCSSFLKANAGFLKAYGVERYFALDSEVEVECVTLPIMLAQLGIPHVDFLKTDLEGLDFEILSSSSEIVARALVLQTETRFQPFYQGEPTFQETTSYLADFGFELITLRPETWKYNTPHRDFHRDGRLVMADAIFFMSIPMVRKTFGDSAPAALVKQIILARALGMRNYAEWIYENMKESLSETVRSELAEFLHPSRDRNHLALTLVASMSRSALGGRILRKVRRALSSMEKITALHKDYPHVGTL